MEEEYNEEKKLLNIKSKRDFSESEEEIQMVNKNYFGILLVYN